MSKSLNNTLFFYQGDKLITVKQGDQQRAIFRNADVPLAEVQTGETPGTGLLVTDDKGSVLGVQSEDEKEEHCFSSYGHDPTLPSPLTMLAFNAERIDPSAASYCLGNGRRAYNPRLMRFTTPDTFSPFGSGGLNTYTYCLGDPVNRVDPSGNISFALLAKRIIFQNAVTKTRSKLGITNGTIIKLSNGTTKERKAADQPLLRVAPEKRESHSATSQASRPSSTLSNTSTDSISISSDSLSSGDETTPEPTFENLPYHVATRIRGNHGFNYHDPTAPR